VKVIDVPDVIGLVGVEVTVVVVALLTVTFTVPWLPAKPVPPLYTAVMVSVPTGRVVSADEVAVPLETLTGEPISLVRPGPA
jgi:hypothetical protein